MYKLIKFIAIFFIPISAILLILLFINILVLDFKYAHKSLYTYQKPFNWTTYKFEINLLKFVKNLKNSKDIGLEKKSIYITEKSQKALLSDVPMSTKKWQKGFFLTKDNDFRKIKVRYRGDNPRNWLFNKKNLRIKTQKKDQFGQFRYYDYDPFKFQKYVSGKIANRIKVISPKFNLIELYINDNSKGIYIQSEKINENFLRRNKIMPVNIYKGEQINSESIIKTNNNLFNNHFIWKKTSIFNQVEDEDKSDLIYFLNLLRKSETDDISYLKLLSMLNLSEWGRFAAYQIITDNYHNDNGHNMRIIFDPWSGKIHPIIYDPVIGDKIFNEDIIDLNRSSHDLLLLLNRNSLFIHEKYKELFKLLSVNNVISHEIDELKILEKKISISENRDVDLQRTVFDDLVLLDKINPLNIIKLSSSKKRFLLVNKLQTYNNKLKDILSEKPKSSWSFSKNIINVNINDDLPISDIRFFFNENVPKWISIDLNDDKVVSNNEKFFPNKNGIINLPLTLYSNRIVVAKDKYQLTQPQLITTKTRFEFKLEKPIKPYKIEAQNPFTQKTLNLKTDNTITLPAHRFNLPIRNAPFLEKPLILKGIINVDKNLIFKKKVIIKAGSKFKIKKNTNIIFLNTVEALGTKENPIIFSKKNNNNLSDNWGSLVLQGKKTKNSRFHNIVIDGGSGGRIDQFMYSSMFSLHNTSDISLKNIILKNNKIYDDVIHLVYCKNVIIDNILIKDAFSDALDIDISEKILIKNSKFYNPKNDAIDTMESTVIVDSSEISSSGDKGISIGENSNVIIHNTHIYDNNIGIAVKDNSIAKAFYTDFINNTFQVESYQKNYKYGNGGRIEITKSNFISDTNKIESDKGSSITIDDSTFNNKVDVENSNIILSEEIDFDGNKTSIKNVNIDEIDLMMGYIKNVKNVNIRGSDFTNNY